MNLMPSIITETGRFSNGLTAVLVKKKQNVYIRGFPSGGKGRLQPAAGFSTVQKVLQNHHGRHRIHHSLALFSPGYWCHSKYPWAVMVVPRSSWNSTGMPVFSESACPKARAFWALSLRCRPCSGERPTTSSSALRARASAATFSSRFFRVILGDDARRAGENLAFITYRKDRCGLCLNRLPE